MKTLRLFAENKGDSARAGQILRRGGLVAIPTETVYGLAADGLNDAAVMKIFEAKGRPADNPLILHIANPAELEALCRDIPPVAWTLAERFWPGPLTMVLPKRGCVGFAVTAGLDTVAVRCPAHPAARDVIACAGRPLAAPSANLSGRPSPTTAAHVLADFDGKIDAVLDGGACGVGLESTVIDLSGEPLLLRPGRVTETQLRALLPGLRVHSGIETPVEGTVKSPGLLHRHYAPRAPFFLLRGGRDAVFSYISEQSKKNGVAVLCTKEEANAFAGLQCVACGRDGDAASVAAELFDGLRRLDGLDAELLFARYPEGGGIMAAVRNRLLRAADFQVIDV